MKVISIFLIITVGSDNFFSKVKSKFIAVSPLVEFEKFYTEPWLVYHDNISPKMKADICADVVGSPLFDKVYQMDLINPTDGTISRILEENYPSIYADLYEHHNSSNTTVFANAYRQRDITIGNDVVPEFVFTCLAMDRAAGNITRYFISRAHLMNVQSCRHHPDQMKGLFVFLEKGDVLVTAVAEEPGYVVNPSNHHFNVSFKSLEIEIQIGKYEGHEIEDSICGLTTYQKIRLCTLVLTSGKLREEVTFVPDKNYTNAQCHRGVIQLNENNGTSHDVKMIGCKATKAGRTEAVMYYISAGFQSHDYFICKEPNKENMTIVAGVGCRINDYKS